MPHSSYLFIGRTLLRANAAMLGLDGVLQLASPPAMVEALTHLGFAPDIGPYLAMITLSCALLLAIPETALIGAIATTGFVGGAVCAHLRMGELASQPQLICVAIGAGVWIGTLLTNPGLASQIFGGKPRTE
jgi:DoxX-like family